MRLEVERQLSVMANGQQVNDAFDLYVQQKVVRQNVFPQGVKLDRSHARIFLPKLGWLRYRKSRDILGTIKNVTVSCTGDTGRETVARIAYQVTGAVMPSAAGTHRSVQEGPFPCTA